VEERQSLTHKAKLTAEKGKAKALQFLTPQKQQSSVLYYSRKEKNSTQTKLKRANGSV
jgi:hypothetical protein